MYDSYQPSETRERSRAARFAPPAASHSTRRVHSAHHSRWVSQTCRVPLSKNTATTAIHTPPLHGAFPIRQRPASADDEPETAARDCVPRTGADTNDATIQREHTKSGAANASESSTGGGV